MNRTQSHKNKFWKNWIPKKYFNKHFLCQCYSEMKFKSEIPKFSQKSKKEKGAQNNDKEIKVLFDSYLKQNQNDLIP